MPQSLGYKTALITGASSGIGECFANTLAEQGLDLVLVARSADRLEALAKKLHKLHGKRVEVIVADLAQPSPGAAIAAEVGKRGMFVDLLINNAGFATIGAFHLQEPAREQQEIALNVGAVVDLAHAFLPEMLDRGEGGGIVNVASLAAFQPTPYMSVYGATKAFVLSFSQALWAEYQKQGLRVVAVCPGPVETGFFEATGHRNLRKTVPNAIVWPPEVVVRESLKALKAGQTIVVPGSASKAVALASRVIPRKLLARVSARVLHR